MGQEHEQVSEGELDMMTDLHHNAPLLRLQGQCALPTESATEVHRVLPRVH